MRVLVTGAGGFLGLAIANRLIARGDDVHSFSRSTHPTLETLGVTQHRGDLADARAVDAAVEGCDLVFHVAARPGAWGPYRAYHDTNVRGTQHVLTACRSHGVRDLVYTSTPSVISRGEDLEGVDETTPHPSSFRAHYPATKAIAENMVRQASDDALRTVSLRPHLVWGPGDTSLLPRLVSRARRGRLRRIGATEKLIDTTFIDDAVDAHLLAADALAAENVDHVAGNVYFISGPKPVGTWTMIDRMLAAAGLPPVTRRISRTSAHLVASLCELTYGLLRLRAEPPLTRWVVDELSTAHWFDIGAARRDLGYDPAVTLDVGMERLAAWWQSEDHHHA
jgi:2-alkyl-3-oxoalkanoate reductase